MKHTAVSLCLLLAACGRPLPTSMPSLGVTEALGGADLAGFARATEPPQLRFPRDHGAHPEFRTEWWYFTGNVQDEAGRPFGVQLVFFRQGLAPVSMPRAAKLAAREVMLAHTAVTDVQGGRFHFAERMARASAGLGGVVGPGDAQPFAVSCAEWSARALPGGDGFLPIELRAADRDFAFVLQVSPGEPVVLQGDRGLSQKSAAPGNASIYYSMPRLPIDGTIEVGGVRHAVRGEAWLDREWSTSALGADQVGWDWFSLQLDNGEELMWYQLRRRDGTTDAFSKGVLVDADGTVTHLEPARVSAEPQGRWTADDGGASYPARWRVVGVDPEFDLHVEPLLPDQELRVLVRYWEGAVAVRGTRRGVPVAGRGYLEMTGYAARR